MNFKIGDRVRVVGGDYILKARGTEGILTSVSYNSCKIKVLNHRDHEWNGCEFTLSLDHLEKIDEPKHSRKRHLLDVIQVED